MSNYGQLSRPIPVKPENRMKIIEALAHAQEGCSVRLCAIEHVYRAIGLAEKRLSFMPRKNWPGAWATFSPHFSPSGWTRDADGTAVVVTRGARGWALTSILRTDTRGNAPPRSLFLMLPVTSEEFAFAMRTHWNIAFNERKGN